MPIGNFLGGGDNARFLSVDVNIGTLPDDRSGVLWSGFLALRPHTQTFSEPALPLQPKVRRNGTLATLMIWDLVLFLTCFERWCPTKRKRTCCDIGAGAVHAQGRSAIRHCSAQVCVPFASSPSRAGMGGCLTRESPRAKSTVTQQKQGVGKVCSTIRRAIRDKGHSMTIGFRSRRDRRQHGPPKRCRGKAPQKKER